MLSAGVTPTDEPPAPPGSEPADATEAPATRRASGRGVRVAIAVEPPLAADALRMLLEHDRVIAVAVYPAARARTALTSLHIDIAIVTPGPATPVAPTVITLDDAATSVGGGRVRVADGRSRELPHLDAVLAEVRSHVAGAGAQLPSVAGEERIGGR